MKKLCYVWCDVLSAEGEIASVIALDISFLVACFFFAALYLAHLSKYHGGDVCWQLGTNIDIEQAPPQ